MSATLSLALASLTVSFVLSSHLSHVLKVRPPATRLYPTARSWRSSGSLVRKEEEAFAAVCVVERVRHALEGATACAPLGRTAPLPR
jgi:hypothetical protein